MGISTVVMGWSASTYDKEKAVPNPERQQHSQAPERMKWVSAQLLIAALCSLPKRIRKDNCNFLAIGVGSFQTGG